MFQAKTRLKFLQEDDKNGLRNIVKDLFPVSDFRLKLKLEKLSLNRTYVPSLS